MKLWQTIQKYVFLWNKFIRYAEVAKNPLNLVIKMWNSYVNKWKNKFTIPYK